MQVIKFGGTSIGSVEAIKSTVEIITNIESQCIVVFSAFSGVTNILCNINSYIEQKEINKAQQCLLDLRERHISVICELIESVEHRENALTILERHLSSIDEQINGKPLDFNPKEILAQGELLSSQIIYEYFQSLDLDASLIEALGFMRINAQEEPDNAITKDLLQQTLNKCESKYILTQGYICRNASGEVDNLKRGGSDYSAALIGVAVDAGMIQIWTDIDGIHNNDPRCVSNTRPINRISFEEAAELAYFGAKVLHPQSLLPAKEANIPVLLKNTFAPQKPGTLIQRQAFVEGVRAFAAKDGITSIKIKSYRMLMSYGFLKNIFEVFEQYKTSIDVITTSEVGVSLTIDSIGNLGMIVEELQRIGEVTVENDLSVICIAGYFPEEQTGQGSQILAALDHIPVKMISFGGSLHNVSLIIDTKHKVEALNSLHKNIFNLEEELIQV